MFLSRFQSGSSSPRIHQSWGPPFLWEHKIQTCSAVFNKGNNEGELGAWDIVGPTVLLNTSYFNCFPCAGVTCCNFIIHVNGWNYRLWMNLQLAWIKLANECLTPGCQGNSSGQPRGTQLVYLEKWRVEMGRLVVDRAKMTYWICIANLY